MKQEDFIHLVTAKITRFVDERQSLLARLRVADSQIERYRVALRVVQEMDRSEFDEFQRSKA